MNKIRIAVIQFPGSNTERETHLALQRAGLSGVDFLWNRNYADLDRCDGFVLTGGFSYEDRSRSGIIASLDPVMDVLRAQAGLGKPILVICNGAQILIESGMIPELEGHQVGMALTRNKRVRNGRVLGIGYYNAWVHLKLNSLPDRCAFTRHLGPNRQLRIPVAHGEGRFLAHSDLLAELKDREQITLQYCDRNGDAKPEFPVNPNGSDSNIAAICNPRGNVMAMMPHPERTLEGDPIFSSMRDFIENPSENNVPPLTYHRRPFQTPSFKPVKGAVALTVKLLITDNEAISVEKTLTRLGIPLRVERQTYWEILTDGGSRSELLAKIEASGELFNPNKEAIGGSTSASDLRGYLVYPKEDWIGKQKLDSLRNRFGLNNIREIRRGVLWRLTSRSGPDPILAEKALQTNIFFNPISHICYEY